VFTSRLFSVCYGASLAVSCPLTGVADTVTVTAAADATLIEVSPNNSSGGAEFFNAGTTQNVTRNRALIRFDVSSQLPQGALITGVSLQLDVVRQPVDGFEASPFSIHRVLRPWGEGTTVPNDNPGGLGGPAAPGDATWSDRFAFDQPWAAPGGEADIDYLSLSSGAIIMYGTLDSPYAFESTSESVADVQLWLDDPNSNFGWMLMTDFEDTAFTARRFASREDPLGRGPRLTIEYTVVPEPGTVALFAVGSVVLAGVLRRHSRATAAE
jgi:hypothetical protein